MRAKFRVHVPITVRLARTTNGGDKLFFHPKLLRLLTWEANTFRSNEPVTTGITMKTLRWSLGDLLGQLLVIPAIVIAAFFGLNYESWWVFFGISIPLVALAVFVTKFLSGKNPYR